MGDDEEIIYIYALIDPRDNEVRYVGKTNDLYSRFFQHISPSSLKNRTYKNNWIKSLLEKDLRPIISVLEKTNQENWEEREICWIKHYRDLGTKLTNIADGGAGGCGRVNRIVDIFVSNKKKNFVLLNKSSKSFYAVNRKNNNNAWIKNFLKKNVSIIITRDELNKIKVYPDLIERTVLLDLLIFDKMSNCIANGYRHSDYYFNCILDKGLIPNILYISKTEIEKTKLLNILKKFKNDNLINIDENKDIRVLFSGNSENNVAYEIKGNKYFEINIDEILQQ
jgi:hypothetical protein